MQIGLIDCGSSKVTTIRQLLQQMGGEVTPVPLSSANGHDFSPYAGVVISGGDRLFTDPDTSEALLQSFIFVDALRVPTLGICLGHQAIALRHGGASYRGPERREQEDIQLLADHALFADIQSPATFKTNHCEGIHLPTGFHHLATSTAYQIEAMACIDQPLYGVQFHPEASGAVGEMLFRNFCRMVQALE